MWTRSVLFIRVDAAVAEGESDMDLDLLAESDTDNESVHGGSVHSVGPYEDNATRSTNRNTSSRANASERTASSQSPLTSLISEFKAQSFFSPPM